MNKSILVFGAILLSYSLAFAQYDLPFGFEKNFYIAVKDTPGNTFASPWAGGMNACQFGEIDLYGNGIRDLVVFDRNGNRTLTYQNAGIAGESSYTYDPSLASKLPHFDDWVIFADYNMDGLNDIFAYSKGFAGIKVYRNTGNPAEMFELVVFPYLKSFQGNGYVNVLVTYADYPAIYDIDNDGDLDLLTFWGLGSFVEFHQNESMERYGTADSLIFRKSETCWGRFAESDESNIIYLDTCFDRHLLSSNSPHGLEASTALEEARRGEIASAYALETPLPFGGVEGGDLTSAFALEVSPPFGGAGGGALAFGDPRHTGSTFMLFDNNGDGLLDLLLGDVDYSSPALLINGGTPRDALMISHTYKFPDNIDSINMLSFPVMSFLDVNNDGNKDMIVSPFDPSLVKSENLNNIWLYQNNGETNDPDFELTKKAFLQDEMLDFGAGAVPVFFDHNMDGLMDIVVGNYGYLDSTYYGPGMNLYCNYRAQLALLENTGTSGQPAFKLINRNYADLPSWFPASEKPYAAIPAFADLDGDGDEDMLVGNAEGTLFHFKNVAAIGQPANFQLVDDHYQNLNADAYSAPQFFDLNNDGLKDLLVGKRNGTISFYQNTGNNSNPEFTLVNDSLGMVDLRNPNLSIFGYCIPHFYRDGQGKIHLFAGSEFGEIYYYDNIENNLDGEFNLVMKNYLWIDEGLRSAVAIGNLDGDNFPEMIVGNYSGGLSYFKGTTAPPAAVSENKENNWGIRVFPNPANDFISIDYPANSIFTFDEIKLLDFSGKEINAKFENQNRIFVGKLPDGIYLLQIKISTPGGNRLTGFKIIIQH